MGKTISGVFEKTSSGGGTLCDPHRNYESCPDLPIVPADVARAAGLRGGELVECTTRVDSQGGGRSSRHGVRRPTVRDIQQMDGLAVEDRLSLTPFEDLVAIDPGRRVRFETPGGPLSMRVIDLLTPIGFGQRGLIVAPPRTGKTVLLQQLAAGLAQNHPDVYMIVLLIDERPEEVTEMRRTVHGEVVASSNDHDAKSHIRLAKLVSDRAKRLVETGADVLVLLDSLTRLGRAFNTGIRGRGRTLSGGLDAAALTEPKSVFGAARNVEGGGSLTIVATCLIDTGSRMDEVIFNEFKGTGNMEIMLSRMLANRRVWPAIDLHASGTRKEERLLSPEELEVSYGIRRSLLNVDTPMAMERLLEVLGKSPTNADFVSSASNAPRGRLR